MGYGEILLAFPLFTNLVLRMFEVVAQQVLDACSTFFFGPPELNLNRLTCETLSPSLNSRYPRRQRRLQKRKERKDTFDNTLLDKADETCIQCIPSIDRLLARLKRDYIRYRLLTLEYFFEAPTLSTTARNPAANSNLTAEAGPRLYSAFARKSPDLEDFSRLQEAGFYFRNDITLQSLIATWHPPPTVELPRTWAFKEHSSN